MAKCPRKAQAKIIKVMGREPGKVIRERQDSVLDRDLIPEPVSKYIAITQITVLWHSGVPHMYSAHLMAVSLKTYIPASAATSSFPFLTIIKGNLRLLAVAAPLELTRGEILLKGGITCRQGITLIIKSFGTFSKSFRN